MMEYSRDEGLRKYWDEFSPPFHKDGDGPPAPKGESGAPYNRNQDSHAIENVARWYDYWRERPGTGERVNAGGVNIYFSDSQTHQRGAENYRRSGEVDAMRIPKDGFHAHRVMWNGWVDVEKPDAYIIGHWNYQPGVTKPVHAVSSADRAELFINGKPLGFGAQSSRFLFTWKDVRFEPGVIKVVGYDTTGSKICETEKRTAGAPAALKLTSRTAPSGLVADGADMALVQVEVVDAVGNRCPTASSMIAFDLSGPAEWRGGIAQGPDNFILSKKLPAECGVNRVLIRSLPQAGDISLKATSNGLKPAALALKSKPMKVTNGLSATFPGTKPSLQRGPTPPRDSVTPTRKTLHIASATAGARTGEAGAAYDDNERTSWKNDGTRETAWIQFELERPATVSELTLRMGGWRSKSYPVRVTVDGSTAYTGTTPKSLGYVTLPLKPTQGKSVRIALAGDIDEKDGFGIVEVTGKKTENAKRGGKGALEIVEAEIYGPVSPVR